MNLESKFKGSVVLSRIIPLLETSQSCLKVIHSVLTAPTYDGWAPEHVSEGLLAMLNVRIMGGEHLVNLTREMANELAKSLDAMIEYVKSVPEADDKTSDR